jgi:hypothetical protein
MASWLLNSNSSSPSFDTRNSSDKPNPMKTFFALLFASAFAATQLHAAGPALAATYTARGALQKVGQIQTDGTITATATGTGGTSTVTLQKPLGVITTGAITTAAAADHVMTVTND